MKGKDKVTRKRGKEGIDAGLFKQTQEPEEKAKRVSTWVSFKHYTRPQQHGSESM